MTSHAHHSEDHQPHTTGHSNAHLKDRSPNPSDPAFKIVEAVTKLEQSTANLRVSMDKIVSILSRSAGGGGFGGHHGMGLSHSLLFWGHFSRHGQRTSENFFRDFFATGRRVGKDFWIMDGGFRGRPGAVAEGFRDRLLNGTRVTTAASLGLAQKGLQEASPETASTLRKSFDLFLAHAESGLVKPAAKLSLALQDAAQGLERQPEGVQNLIGYGTAGTIAVGGAVLALGTLTRAIQGCATAAGFAANMFRGAGATSRAAVAAQAGGTAAESVLGSTATGGAAGAATNAARASRLSRFGSLAGRYGGPLAALVGGLDYQSTNEPIDLIDKFGPAQGAGFIARLTGLPSPADLAKKYLGLGGGSETFSDIKRFTSPFGFLDETLKKYTGHSLNPMAMFKDTPADPYHVAEKNEHNIEPFSKVAPAFMPIEDVWKSVAMSVVTKTPLDIQKEQAELQNYQRLVELQQEANGHLAKIADRPPGLAARP